MKTCSKCKIEQSIDCFYKNSRYKNGVKGTCKKCDHITSIASMKKYRSTEEGLLKSREAVKKSVLKDPEKNKWACKKSIYKSLGIVITKEEYVKKLELQNNRCAICNTLPSEKKSLALDHCHVTLKVRGFLCDNCNTAIGKFKDNLELLSNAITYLKSY